ncbi:MAG TPA: glycosyl hydrolase family 79 C-terminal domain-containing protein [Chthonomonas sp.]|jgi:hypothetical protein|uniref:glycosyl hydrolase family 79 C-terminal domain-containing protein n=1 Tax=Chthonomonas sp. TaxID=2282153 RepID=UPI002B4AC65C|nr:glycosyl hydrolase family 79 C-terminal domain-containing protein [Chthonomonas sp.]HLH80487.1 glycosyl hydrolase family 79 C-terminal domain-containing protein [Chthonomonas sp.]
MRTRLSPWGIVLLFTALVWPLYAFAPSAPVVDVRVLPEPVAPAIPKDFLGLSYEAPALTSPYFDLSNRVYVQLLRNLGPGSFRFGGNSVENTFWLQVPIDANQTAPRPLRHPTVLTGSDLDRVFKFAHAIGWHVILGVNLGHFDPQMASDEAHYAVTHGGSTLTGIEIGNEADLYGGNGWRTREWNYAQYHHDFTAYVAAIEQKTPGTPIVAPAFCCYQGYRWLPQLLRDDASKIHLVSFHMYPLYHAPGSKGPTAEQLLSTKVANWEDQHLQELASDVAPYRLPLRMAETNSVAGGGMPGISDTYVAALWVADYLFRVAEYGLNGVNFHGGFFRGGYSPIWEQNGVFSAAPEYYGILLFHEASQGRPVQVQVDAPSDLNVVAHAVAGSRGRLYVAIINKDFQNGAEVHLQLPSSFRYGEMLRLSGPAANAQEGITLGGRAVSADGTWSPVDPERVKVNDRRAIVSVPALSAVLITFYK